jgi:galactokinase
MNKSQAGLRNNYEISCPEIDWLVKRALEIDGVLTSRMIGKGFGGCTLSVMRSAALPEYLSRLEEYERIFGFKPNALEIFIGAGMIVE